ncbi:DUF7537 family lipoprotein [Halorientalis halophila]|uniref:DUF7537 family lipoprotein n=1 Tax=Halorientalis halophila TaxID=3108499 RepID=UPI00300B3C75
MDRRVLLAVALAAVTLLAGCSWVAEDPTTPSSPSNSSDGPQDTGIPYERLDDHSAALANESYDLGIDLEIRTPDRRRNATVNVSSDPVGERQLIRTESPNGSLDRYLAGQELYTRVNVNGTTEYNITDLGARNVSFAAVHGSGIRVRRLATIYEFGTFERAGNVTRDGERYAAFDLTEPATGPNATVTLNDSSGRILIDQNGIIRRATIDLRGTQSGEPFVYAVDYRIERVGNVTIDEPAWFDEARSGAISTSRSENQTTSRSG